MFVFFFGELIYKYFVCFLVLYCKNDNFNDIPVKFIIIVYTYIFSKISIMLFYLDYFL